MSEERRDVRDVMSRTLVVCCKEDTLAEVARRMWLEEVACTPVLAGGGGQRPVGVLTERDICRAAARGLPLDCTPAAHVMEEKVWTCWPTDSLEAAVAIMRAHRVRRLLVVEPGGRLVGLLSLSDIARSIATPREPSQHQDLAATYAAAAEMDG